jgi:UDP-arabinose 4-epimerase
MPSTNKNILITGGAGYIRSHACKAVSLAGYIPVTYDNLSRGHEWAVRWGPLEIGDIQGSYRLDAVLSEYMPLAIMHFATLSYVGESVTDPLSYYKNNVLGTYNLLDRMLAKGINKIIFSSTCAIYGAPLEIPINEEHTKNPINPYVNTKGAIETMIADLSHAKKLSYVSLRYFNAAGADPDNEVSECHEPETHLIPLILDTASGIRPYIEVYGNDYDTPNGTCIRDYIHVTDLANAHIIALDYLLNGGNSEYYNLGTDNGYSVKEIINSVQQVTNIKITVKTVQRRPGDPSSLIADSSKFKNALGWELKHSNINQIIETAWKWKNTNEIR